MADTKISALPSASTLAGTEILAGDQSGTSVGVTTAQIVALALTTGVTVGAATADTVGFYGATPVARRATTTLQLTSSLASVTTSSTSQFGAKINSACAALQEVMNTLFAYGLWGTH